MLFRSKRIAVANDLKDLAADEKVWMVVTYQSTIEDREWLLSQDFCFFRLLTVRRG